MDQYTKSLLQILLTLQKISKKRNDVKLNQLNQQSKENHRDVGTLAILRILIFCAKTVLFIVYKRLTDIDDMLLFLRQPISIKYT